MPARPLPARAPSARLLVWMLLAAAAVLGAPRCPGSPAPPDTSGYVVVQLVAGPTLEMDARVAFQNATPGTIIEFPAGVHAFQGSLTLDTSHVVVRGQGMDQTVLDFTGQTSGSQGILARGDEFAARDLTILNPAGDGIKTEFVNGATFERIRVEWTTLPKSTHGDYGLYPAQNRNVLIDGCEVIGARDAGIYVGQSENIIVRNSISRDSVLGFEVENSFDADVHDNLATNNTGGIAVLNLPNLQRKNGARTRVFNNTVIDNNTPNFAAGGILRDVPGGTGVIVIGNDQVEIFNNTISGNGTVNLIVSGFEIAQRPINDTQGDLVTGELYDPWAEGIAIHDNTITNGGFAPQEPLGLLVATVFQVGGFAGPADIVVGGYVDEAKVPGGVFDPNVFPETAQLPVPLRICIQNNGAATFGSLNGIRQPAPLVDPAPHACSLPPLPAVVLDPPAPLPTSGGYTPEEIAALCTPVPEEVNYGAFVVDCPKLSDYGLFNDGDPRYGDHPGALPYDLTTPLFSDHAIKHRAIYLPPGAQMTWSDTDVFDLPVGTIIAKTFSFRDPTATPAREVMIETRLLIHREDGWHGLPYLWDVAETEAVLTPGGATVPVTLLDSEDRLLATNYEVPARSDCGSCHFGSEGDEPIGPKARLLNRELTGRGQNQLDVWAAEGVLVGSPGSQAAPRLAVWDDPGTGTLEERAKAYLESNCGHCHNPQGRAGFTGLWLSHDGPLDVNYGVCKQPVAAGSASGGLQYDLVPGDPAASILVFRMDSVAPAIKMPELAKSLVHEMGVQLVSDWIASLPSASCP